VVTRQARRWNVTTGVGTVVYKDHHTRAAHLGESSLAWPQMVHFLTEDTA